MLANQSGTQMTTDGNTAVQRRRFVNDMPGFESHGLDVLNRENLQKLEQVEKVG